MDRRLAVPAGLLCLAAVFAAGYWFWPWPRSPVKITVFDQVARPGETATLAAKLEHGGRAGVTPDMRGYTLHFRGLPEHAEVTTAGDGLAVLGTKTLTDPSGDPLSFTVRFPGSPHHRHGQARGRLFVWRETERILITDIDHTISDFSEARVPVTDNQDIPPMPDSVEALTELAVAYRVVYLTARDDALYSKTRAWLAEKRFPEGPVFCRDFRVGDTQAGFKEGFIHQLKSRYPNIVYGVGERPGDARAYLNNGVQAICLDPGGTGEYPKGAIVVRNWREVLETIKARGQSGATSGAGAP